MLSMSISNDINHTTAHSIHFSYLAVPKVTGIFHQFLRLLRHETVTHTVFLSQLSPRSVIALHWYHYFVEGEKKGIFFFFSLQTF